MVRCECGQPADPDWGQCYECWLADRLAAEAREPQRPDPRDAELQAEYEADMWRQYTTDLWAVALAAGEIQLAQPGEEAT